jgi:hypothetical protein
MVSYPRMPHGRTTGTELRMTARTATACFFLGLASFAAGKGAAEKALPRIANPEALAIEMAKALASDDRERFIARSTILHSPCARNFSCSAGVKAAMAMRLLALVALIPITFSRFRPLPRAWPR